MTTTPQLFKETPAAAGVRLHASRWRKPELLVLSSCVAYLITVASYCGWGRIFWEDEMLGWMMVRDPSWKHMLLSWRQGADGGGLFFYLLGHLWISIFGPSVTSFRAISSVCFAVAFILCWLILRTFYTTSIVAFTSLSLWMMSPVLVQHMTEGRFYGLLVAAASAVLWLGVFFQQVNVLSWRNYLAAFLANGLLVSSHVLGVVYSATILAGLIVLDVLTSRMRPRLYLSIAGAWLLLVPALPAIQASARVGKPYFWTVQPNVTEFIFLYTGFTPILALVLACLCGSALWSARGRGVASVLGRSFRQRRPIYVFSGVLFFVPVIFLIEGVRGPALCISRYLQPVAIGTLFLMTEAVTILKENVPRIAQVTPTVRTLSWLVFLAVLVLYDFGYRPHHTTLLKDYTAELSSLLPRDEPIVCEDAFSFTEVIAKQHGSPLSYTYLLDWANSVSPQAPRLEVTQYHLLENWKQVGYFSGSIRYADEFLRSTPAFYTVSFSNVVWNPFHKGYKVQDRLPQIGSDLHQRLAGTPGYRVTLEKAIPLKEVFVQVWRVCRLDSGCTGGPPLSGTSSVPSPIATTAWRLPIQAATPQTASTAPVRLRQPQ